MKRSTQVLILFFVPGAAAYYAIRYVVRKLSAWKLESEMTMPASWRQSYAEREGLAEMSASVPEPRPWARPPRISDGPTSDYKRVGVR